MALKFLTLSQIKSQLRIDWTDEDVYLNLLGEAAEEAVLDYIKKDYEWTTVTVPKNVILSMLVLCSTYYEAYRNGDDFDNPNVAYGYFPPAVTSLLHRYRTPALG